MANNDLFGSFSTGGDAFGAGDTNNLFGNDFLAKKDGTTGGTGNLFGTTTTPDWGTGDMFGTTATTAQVRFPKIWPDDATLGDKYSEIVRKDKTRLEEYCVTNKMKPGTFQSEFQMYFEREPNNPTQKKIPNYLPEGFYTRRIDPRKAKKPILVPIGVMVLMHQYDQMIRDVKLTISEKIQPVINELKRLSADLRRNTLKHKNAMANKYNALKVPDGSASDYRSDLGRSDSSQTLRDLLTRDIRIMQYVSKSDGGSVGLGMGSGNVGEFPSTHIKVEVRDLYRRKHNLAVQIRELESALLTPAGEGGDLSTDLVHIIEEQYKMYESIAAKIAVIYQRVEEEKQAIRAGLRANPDGKTDPW